MQVVEKQHKRLERRAGILRALANPSRLLMLEQMENGYRTVSELTELVGSDISTVSRHLMVLKNAGLVDCCRVGNRHRYSLKAACVLNFLDCVEDIFEGGTGSCSREFLLSRSAVR